MNNIILTGFMGSGKSSVGRALAREMGVDLVDTDEVIVSRAGIPIHEIFDRHGEERFREIESEVIEEAASRDNVVIATGGGALLSDVNLSNLRESGVIVYLAASVEEIKKRVGSGRGRPVLSGGSEKKSIAKLLEQRKPFYEKADVVVETTGRSIKNIVMEIRERIESDVRESHEVTVQLGERSYPIFIGRGELSGVGERMKEAGLKGKAAVVTNPLVGGLYGATIMESLVTAGYEPLLIEIPDGEEYKTLTVASTIYDQLVANRFERGSIVVALGGGVIGDIAGFVAATFLRGLPYVQVPTTLLAQVDSSVGGKTAVNHPEGKNLIGAFYQPTLVVIDPALLESLDMRDIRAGMAEVIKYGIIQDETFFSFLEEHCEEVAALGDALLHAIRRSCEIKANVVSADEREGGIRAILNFGHTIGHAIEAVSGYGEYRHGEAVSIGTVFAAELSLKMGLCGKKTCERIKALLSKAALPVTLPSIPMDTLIKSMELDKKVLNKRIRFVLVEKIGRVVVRELEKEALEE
ncbi:MAG: 3-dehydroquinate synthase [Thermodesulfobacteriota bacterium]